MCTVAKQLDRKLEQRSPLTASERVTSGGDRPGPPPPASDRVRFGYRLGPLVGPYLSLEELARLRLDALSVRGVLRVIRAKDGTLVYEKKLDLERPQASFSFAGDRLYVFGAEGRALVLRAGGQFEELGRNTLEPLRATPFFHPELQSLCDFP